MKDKRKKLGPEMKASVALAALKEDATAAELSTRFGVHQSQIFKWKRQLIDNAALAFVSAGEVPAEDGPSKEELLRKIGELTVERDFLANGLRRFR